ncbi:MAG: hypothetical protein ACTHOF_07630 [Flavisolibacter sp.]
MKQKRFFFLTVLLLGITHLQAQTDSPTVDSSMNNTIPNLKQKQPANFIKFNLLGILLKNYSIQYERVLTRKISFVVAYRTMPQTTIPFKNQIVKLVGDDDPDTKETIEKLRISNYAITPEIRFYLSKKGYGQGFYIAPFYRYASFNTNNVTVHYEDNAGNQSSISLSGKLTTNTGGILFGVQKSLGKHVCLDWWLFGPHYGNGIGNFTGTPDKPLTQDEQTDLKQQLDDIDIPLTNKTVTVTAGSASLKLDGPWGGLRMGLSIGVSF